MSKFKDSIFKKIRKENVESFPEEQKKEIKLQKVEDVIEKIADKKNRILFYCPDVPFPVGTVKTIYDHVLKLKKLDYQAEVIHEMQGFKPMWLDNVDFKDIKIHYLSKKDKKNNLTAPEFPFQPGDTIIVPDGFAKIMEGFYEVKQVQKIVFIMGYGGLATAEYPWSMLGFNNAICVSESLKNDYQKLWPEINYHVVGYSIDQEIFKPVEPKNKRPLISLAYRDRESAARFLNIFHSQFPYLNMFSFEIVKKKSVSEYAKTLAQSILLVLNDNKSGHPQWPLEAISSNTTVLTLKGRGYDHLYEHPDVITLEEDDEFHFAEIVAKYCLNWLDANHFSYETDKEILKNYTNEKVVKEIHDTYGHLQNLLAERFVALKNTILKQEEEIKE